MVNTGLDNETLKEVAALEEAAGSTARAASGARLEAAYNPHLEMIQGKTRQLEAMVAMLRMMVGNHDSELNIEIIGNYAWLMDDLVGSIKNEIAFAQGVRHE